MKAFFQRKKASGNSVVSEKEGKFDASKLENVEFEDGKFMGGTFQRCVEYMLWKFSEKSMYAVLYCFRPFASPQEMLELLKELLAKPEILISWQSVIDDSVVQERITKVLLAWVSMGFNFDFQPDPKLVKSLHSVLESLLPANEHNRIKLMLLKGKVVPHGLSFPDDTECATQDNLEEIVTGSMYFVQQDLDLVCQEMSNIDYDLYRSIEASELMNKNWQRSNAAELSPTLVALRKRFNQLSFWVITLVLVSVDTKTKQIKMVKQLLDCAWLLYQSRSYNSMGALISALNSVALSRLHYLWDNLSKQDLKRREEMNGVLEVMQNFKVYRQLLEEAAQVEAPCIPYIPLHLRDMLAIFEREDNHLKKCDDTGKPMVNFDKMRALGTTMHTILQFRGNQWRGSVDQVLREFLVGVPFFSEDDLLEYSDRWKAELGEKLADKESTKPNAFKVKAPVVEGYVLLKVMYESWTVLSPIPLTMTFKELRRLVKHIAGKECELRYLTQTGLSLLMSSPEDMPAFLSSSDSLIVEATHQRTVKMTLRGSRSSNTGTWRQRSVSNATHSPFLENKSARGSAITSSGDIAAMINNNNNTRRRSLSSVGFMPEEAKARSDPLLSPTRQSSQSAHSSPLISPALSPMLSPRGEEKKRIVVVELVLLEDDKEQEGTQSDIAISTFLSFEEFRVMLQLLLGYPANVKVIGGGKYILINDEVAWRSVSKKKFFIEKV